MHLIVRNVSEALFVGNSILRARGIRRDSRNGPVLEYPESALTTYLEPCERVLFYPERDANPTFHLFEALWMLAGRDDVEWLTQFNKRMAEYSSDGKTLNGSYGYRWRNYFGYDQIFRAVERLKKYPDDRRTVVAMWDAHDDGDFHIHNDEKDIPCNTHIYFKVRDGRLNMTVCCRSNDMIWGAYGANAVHFSILQEYMAHYLGVPVGTYTQLSDSFHAYLGVLEKLDGIAADYDPYLTLGKDGLHYTPEPLVKPYEKLTWFESDLARFLENPAYDGGYMTAFFRATIKPMAEAWNAWKSSGAEEAYAYAGNIHARDWRRACREWYARRVK